MKPIQFDNKAARLIVTEELERAKKAIRLLGGEIEKIIDYTIPHTEITHRLVVIRKKNHTPKQYPRPFRKISASPL